jgi:hypothetical protein
MSAVSNPYSSTESLHFFCLEFFEVIELLGQSKIDKLDNGIFAFIFKNEVLRLKVSVVIIGYL